MGLYAVVGFFVLAIMIVGWATIGVKQMRQEISRWVVNRYERMYNLAYDTGSEVIQKSRVDASFADRILAVPYPTLRKAGAPWKVISPKKFFKKFGRLEQQLEAAMDSLARSYSATRLDEIEEIYGEVRKLYEHMGFSVSTIVDDAKRQAEPRLKLVE